MVGVVNFKTKKKLGNGTQSHAKTGVWTDYKTFEALQQISKNSNTIGLGMNYTGRNSPDTKASPTDRRTMQKRNLSDIVKEIFETHRDLDKAKLLYICVLVIRKCICFRTWWTV